jgi:hypothetical protein
MLEISEKLELTKQKLKGLRVCVLCGIHIMFTPARDFLLETPWRIIIPNPNVNSHSL